MPDLRTRSVVGTWELCCDDLMSLLLLFSVIDKIIYHLSQPAATAIGKKSNSNKIVQLTNYAVAVPSLWPKIDFKSRSVHIYIDIHTYSTPVHGSVCGPRGVVGAASDFRLSKSSSTWSRRRDGVWTCNLQPVSTMKPEPRAQHLGYSDGFWVTLLHTTKQECCCIYYEYSGKC